MHDSDEMIRQVLDAGARGYLLKSDAGGELVAAVEALRRHKTYFTSKVDRVVLAGYLEHKAQGREIRRDRLTPRQREIVQLLAEGKTSKEVATTLKMSVKTAETHRSNIMKKLDLHSVSDLVRYAIRNNMIEP
jgi:DNA-binding NarL/FixJ family response regulator